MKPRAGAEPSHHKPRILFLYGSLRARSYSRLLAEEAARIITELGAEVRFFNPAGLPLVDSVPADHPKVIELRELSQWSEGQVWSSPERHGAVTGVMKNQIATANGRKRRLSASPRPQRGESPEAGA